MLENDRVLSNHAWFCPKYQFRINRAPFQSPSTLNTVSFSDGKKTLIPFKIKLPLLYSLIQIMALITGFSWHEGICCSWLHIIKLHGGMGWSNGTVMGTLLFPCTLTSPADLTACGHSHIDFTQGETSFLKVRCEFHARESKREYESRTETLKGNPNCSHYNYYIPSTEKMWAKTWMVISLLLEWVISDGKGTGNGNEEIFEEV